MAYEDLRVDIADGVAVLTRDRPEHMNAFSGPLATSLSVALSKRLLWDSRALTRDEVGQRETAYHHVVMGQPDALEGVMVFLERRPPRWALAVPRDWPDEECRVPGAPIKQDSD